ncbi:hypothetical protein I4U23_009806 [Adineta vaga]|nr:hypothetical protein I4U23_009806 [Adineta vaga]
MNDEWSRCPICFEDYSREHRPTTFTCGHSTCIDHTIGTRRLQNCPICRQPLGYSREYHISYNLEEASRFLQTIKNAIDWSKIELPSGTAIDDNERNNLEMIHRDEVYARRLQAELNRRQTRTVNQNAQANEARVRPNEPVGYAKQCGHRCDLLSTTRCCTCSGKNIVCKEKILFLSIYIFNRSSTP